MLVFVRLVVMLRACACQLQAAGFYNNANCILHIGIRIIMTVLCAVHAVCCSMPRMCTYTHGYYILTKGGGNAITITQHTAHSTVQCAVCVFVCVCARVFGGGSGGQW